MAIFKEIEKLEANYKYIYKTEDFENSNGMHLNTLSQLLMKIQDSDDSLNTLTIY